MIKILLGLAVILVLIGGVALYNQETKLTTDNPTATTTNRTAVATSTIGSNNASNTIEVSTTTSSSTNPASVIDLSNTGLTKTPMDIFSKTNTEELDLSTNSLTGSLPAEVRLLQNLKVLNLSGNQFTGVPAEIGQLKNLEVLDLSNNKITGLPNELGNLSKLKVLNLSGNDYSATDLAIIKARLPNTVKIVVD